MATRWPAKPGTEGEGDREYIGPEILMGKYDKPADIFALGLIMFETAGNVELPDNGASWQKLRNGDMSDVPSLTWSSTEASQVFRDASGNPVRDAGSFINSPDRRNSCDLGLLAGASDGGGDADVDALRDAAACKPTHHSLIRSGELTDPPSFMVDSRNEHALDRLVRWMISPEPGDRPEATQLLQASGVRWAETRRRAGATVFEGNWGPADEVLAEDAEMIDA